ncbi:NYN domain-containing protein [Ketobacter sp. MCCC 1A13808]|uniref:NYN domain-containing protein n=1 Tax=Ketobacter sp. MCCC 1A13808 TaxID=2602738 RepID=UPI0012EC0599|nr:NYN domain-containing protein [Ketobacter sp. MCCC 1A13808]MVF14812.1 NYN domain-containing protein [Ketobacter sp. MCCC 1A13808]
MKTIVYVDGYNLYFSRLKHTPYKWLDLFTLFQQYILRPQNPASELLCVKYYTADIKAKFASHGQAASQAQQQYHRALQSPRTAPVEIIKGYYSESKATPMRYKKPPDKGDKVEAWKLEEKQTDVNLALDIYRDAIRGHAEQLVVCTNDTDIVPALKRVREDASERTIGVVFPHYPTLEQRSPSTDLKNLANWVRHHINDTELAGAQFPDRVPTLKKPVDKPKYW